MTATAKIDTVGNNNVPDMAEAMPSGVWLSLVFVAASRVLITVATRALPSTEPTCRVAL